MSTSRKMKVTIAVMIPVVAAFVCFALFYPWPDKETSVGNIGGVQRAERYQAQQLSPEDVSLDDNELPHILQNDQVLKLVRSEEFRSLVQNQAFQQLTQNQDFLKLLSNPQALGLIFSTEVVKLLSNPHFQVFCTRETRIASGRPIFRTFYKIETFRT